MDDELQHGKSRGRLFEMAKKSISETDESTSKETLQKGLELLCAGTIFWAFWVKQKETIADEEIVTLIEERNQARKNKHSHAG